MKSRDFDVVIYVSIDDMVYLTYTLVHNVYHNNMIYISNILTNSGHFCLLCADGIIIYSFDKSLTTAILYLNKDLFYFLIIF